MQRFGVTWPVALNSEMNTWNAYSNQYWPAEYLIDQSGRVAYIHDGEGDYDVTESAIAALLGINAHPTPVAATPTSARRRPSCTRAASAASWATASTTARWERR